MSISNDSTCFSEKIEERASFDAWEIAKKIEKLGDKEAIELFGTNNKNQIFTTFSKDEVSLIFEGL